MEDEDPTLASPSPSPSPSPSSIPSSPSAYPYPVASPLVRSSNRDAAADDGDLDDDVDSEEKLAEAKPRGHEHRLLQTPFPATSIRSTDPGVAVGNPISKPSPAATSGREDCWSEGATWTLIEAWGDRHLRSQAEPQGHQRGGLRQKDWEEVADAVCSRDGGGKQAKSEGQCKNRIDTLKKKYKLERLKPRSCWPYFSRLNDLLAADYEDGTGVVSGNGLSSKPPAGVGFGSFRHQFQQLQMKKKKRTTKKRSYRQLLQSVRPPPFLSPPVTKQVKDVYSSDGLPPTNWKKGKRTGGNEDLLHGGPFSARPLVAKGVGGRSDVGLGQLARAVARLGEVYERVEKTKLRQAEELEKRRMGLAKELEVQRMDFFMKTLVELTHHNQKKPKRQPVPNATEKHTSATNANSRSIKRADSGDMD